MKLFGLIAAILAVAGISAGAMSTSSTNGPASGDSIVAPVSTVDVDHADMDEDATDLADDVGCGRHRH